MPGDGGREPRTLVAHMRDEAMTSLRALNEVIERLRAPGGCPWDRAQTHASLRPYLLEEACEVLEAIDGDDQAALREELGDVLLQVLMHCAITAEDPDGFDIGDVADTTRAKMIYRHPHVFGDVAVDDAAEVVVNWERLKRAEDRGRLSLLDGVPQALPALAQAHALQRRPARIGFDETPDAGIAVDRLRDAVETLDGLAREAPAAARGADWTITEGEIRRGGGTHHQPAAADTLDPIAAEKAIGDVLFAAVAVARRLRVNPEDALRRRTEAFARRYRRLEEQARADGIDLHDVDGAEWSRRWEQTPAG